MNSQNVIIDTGPLVAYLNKKDQYHTWAVSQMSSLNPPLLTCESVLSESCFLLRHFENGIKNLLQFIERRLLIIPFRLEEELDKIRFLLEKYNNIPMSLADACLVRMAEQHANSMIYTLDSDFTIYKKNKKSPIPLLMP